VSTAGDTTMRFTVDGWDPAYGNAFDAEDGDPAGESTQAVDVSVELAEGDWQPIAGGKPLARPSALLFVDGVRRIDARVWIDSTDSDEMPEPSICASIAAGVVCCCAGRAHTVMVESRRLLVTTSNHATDISTPASTWKVAHTTVPAGQPLMTALSLGLQKRLGDLEVATALAARASLVEHGTDPDLDLLVIDGPLKGRGHVPRALGYIKTHRTTYLPPSLTAVVGALKPGERTPVFLLGTGWDRHSWYLRLPAVSRAPWAGVVRIECSADLATPQVIALADVSQLVLPPHASKEFRDPRAPQNLTPIGGLEHDLRHRLGDSRLLFRSLQVAGR
jgi:hypothetical protein